MIQCQVQIYKLFSCFPLAKSTCQQLHMQKQYSRYLFLFPTPRVMGHAKRSIRKYIEQWLFSRSRRSHYAFQYLILKCSLKLIVFLVLLWINLSRGGSFGHQGRHWIRERYKGPDTVWWSFYLGGGPSSGLPLVTERTT